MKALLILYCVAFVHHKVRQQQYWLKVTAILVLTERTLIQVCHFCSIMMHNKPQAGILISYACLLILYVYAFGFR